jgi:hypothetical protein
MTNRQNIVKPVIITFAALYFLIDALFFSLIKPLGTWLAKLPIFDRIGSWVRSLSPYSTLVLFIIPFVLLEPIKPVGAYLIASGHVIDGVLLICVGEILKITIVERLFHVGRDKLMTIPAFARCYEFVMSLRAYLEALPVWQAMLKCVRAIKERGHRVLAVARNCLASLKRVVFDLLRDAKGVGRCAFVARRVARGALSALRGTRPCGS